MQLRQSTVWAISLCLLLLFGLTHEKQAVTAHETAEGGAISASPWTLNSLPISDSNQKASVPSLALGPDGTLHAAFKQGPLLGTTANEAYYAFSLDNGSTWSSPQAIFIDPFSFVVDKVDIAVSNNGTVHASWIERDNSDETYTLYYSQISNGSWIAPEIIELVGNQFFLEQPSLVVSNSQAFIAWRSSARIRFSSRASGAWSDPIIIDSTELPELALDNDGNLHMAYLKAQDSTVVFYTQSTDGGVTWSNGTRISGLDKDVNDIDLAVEGSTVHVVFGASIVVDIPGSPVASTPTRDPYYLSCSNNCTQASGWRSEIVATDVKSINAPADAILLVPSIEVIDEGAATMIFYHGVIEEENLNFEQILGVCYQPGPRASKVYSLPTTFERRMVKPQIEYQNDVMHMVYEQVEGQTTSTDSQEIHYARLDVSCYDQYLPFITRNDLP